MSHIGTCALCQGTRELELSHIVPSFAIKWKKATSGTGYMTPAADVDERVQDGTKLRLLCGECEDRFEKGGETPFSRRIFHPLVGRGQRGRLPAPPTKPRNWSYDRWLLYFAVSACWRVLAAFSHGAGGSVAPTAEEATAEEIWRRYLLGEQDLPAEYSFHIWVPEVETDVATDPGYHYAAMLHRTLGIQTVDLNGGTLALMSLPWFEIVANVTLYDFSGWQGTHVAASGVFPDRQRVDDLEIRDFLDQRAREGLRQQGRISAHTRKRISRDYTKNAGEIGVATPKEEISQRLAEMIAQYTEFSQVEGHVKAESSIIPYLPTTRGVR